MNSDGTPVRWPRRLLLWGALGGLSVAGWVYLLSSREAAPDFRTAVADDFESPALGALWSREKFVPGAVVMQSAIVRAGKSAAQITLREGDHYEPADGLGAKETERAELLEREDLYAREGQACEYAFSIFLPPDFPIVPTRLILAQWKQSNTRASAINNPVIALRYVDGELFITTQTDGQRTIRFRTREELKGRWLDFVVAIRFSRGGDGFVRASLNGREVLDYAGPTAYAEASGYRPQGMFYFKMGLYRDRMAQPMTAYFDAYRKRLLRPDEIPGKT